MQPLSYADGDAHISVILELILRSCKAELRGVHFLNTLKINTNQALIKGLLPLFIFIFGGCCCLIFLLLYSSGIFAYSDIVGPSKIFRPVNYMQLYYTYSYGVAVWSTFHIHVT